MLMILFALTIVGLVIGGILTSISGMFDRRKNDSLAASFGMAGIVAALLPVWVVFALASVFVYRTIIVLTVGH